MLNVNVNVNRLTLKIIPPRLNHTSQSLKLQNYSNTNYRNTNIYIFVFNNSVFQVKKTVQQKDSVNGLNPGSGGGYKGDFFSMTIKIDNSILQITRTKYLN